MSSLVLSQLANACAWQCFIVPSTQVVCVLEEAAFYIHFKRSPMICCSWCTTLVYGKNESQIYLWSSSCSWKISSHDSHGILSGIKISTWCCTLISWKNKHQNSNLNKALHFSSFWRHNQLLLMSVEPGYVDTLFSAAAVVVCFIFCITVLISAVFRKCWNDLVFGIYNLRGSWEVFSNLGTDSNHGNLQSLKCKYRMRGCQW